jgi:hypothetical protein
MGQTTLTWLGTTYAPPHSFIIGWEAPGPALPWGRVGFKGICKRKAWSLGQRTPPVPTVLSFFCFPSLTWQDRWPLLSIKLPYFTPSMCSAWIFPFGARKPRSSDHRLQGALLIQGLYWICGKQTYMVLPSNWFGSCILDTIWPSFFFFPLTRGEKLGVSIYEERASRKRWGTLQIGNWKDNESLLSELFSIMVLPLWQKTDLGAIASQFICLTTLFSSMW